MSKSLDVIYHFAHAILYGKKESTITIVDDEKGIVKISNSMIKSGANNDITVRFLPTCTKTIIATEIAKETNGLALEIDVYSGIIGLNWYTTYTPPAYVSIPPSGRNYPKEYGYILESPPRMSLLFCKKLASIENFQNGALKFHISSFDLKGYPKYLFPEAILELIQLVEPINCPLLESVTMKEVREEKNELPFLSIIEEAVKVVGDHHEDIASMHL